MAPLKPGQIVTVHSLQSEGGKKLNGKKGIVIRKVKDDQGAARYEVKVKGTKPANSSTALKPENLTAVEELLPLPKEGGRPRGYLEDTTDQTEQCSILAELLVMQTENYAAPRTSLAGFPAMSFSELGQYNFTGFTAMQMEWVAGTWAMANLIKRGGAAACEDVAFALLEGDRMYLDVLIITMTNTPFIGPEDIAKEKLLLYQQYTDARVNLTPDQESKDYCRTLKTGSLYILCEVGKMKFGPALFSVMKESKVFFLLIQRMLRLVGREGLGFEDGLELGPMCREVLPLLCRGNMPDNVVNLFEKGPMDSDGASMLLEKVPEFESIEDFHSAFKNTLGALSHGATVSKYMSMLNRKKKKKPVEDNEATKEK